ncbi:cysteine proteinase [Dothidotthia symphoricarpi CBS 119687]|uniref:Cysteine proteinase n=1 Tax=Dothidotthia symphoricarpi CBS 119687 TaxID=1392245 RepID=A0A6A6A7J4_9PLEO|nr:cysteine proteinase [Dothidotthia symphoricarpi CBS 119687]KAF2127810.1 cysteine proteinase [Dothidotthia symphoricarpi CBS 119687]
MSSVSSDGELNVPQEVINEFWENLITKKPAKVTKIFPSSLYAHLLPPKRKQGTAIGKNAAESYQAAANECRARVKRVVRECHRTNEKFTDPEFDIEDLSDKNCLEGLMHYYEEQPVAAASSVSPRQLGDALSTLIRADVLMQNIAPIDFATTAKVLASGGEEYSSGPGSVHRVHWVFDNPKFEIDGFTSSDVVQGSNGDCWFIAAVATICSNPDLIKKVCVERDEECGVYGFVFYRDGEWIWTVVDDNLYLKYKNFDAYGDRYDPTGAIEKRDKQNNLTGSDALYFASCADQNETWLPLLEKAYAKVHGDYDAIAGGISGEAIEDLTGGVTTMILTDSILSKERLWKELVQVNKQFLFSASSPASYGDGSNVRRGLKLSHAYSIIKAVDAEGEDGKSHRLVLIRNPWGKRANAAMGEWTGPWSDGSKEWTPYWMKKLGHEFGDDGLFWMSYADLLSRFDLLDRTRLFNEEWTVVQRWTSLSVAWVTGYLNTKFSVEIKKAGPTVFVLCQLDDRYFYGLEGKYSFDLHFLLQEANSPAGDHIVRARGAWFGNRSISAEVDLEPGIYEVIPKIEASRDASVPEVHDVVTKVAERNPQKLRQIGLNYDIANAKGVVTLSDEEQKKKAQKKRDDAEKKKKDDERAAKEKADFEAWKADDKADYEAWKKHKAKHAAEKEQVPTAPAKDEEDVKNDEKVKKEDSATAPPTENVTDKQESPSTISPTSPDDIPQPHNTHEHFNTASPPHSVYTPSPPATPQPPPTQDTKPKPWNAVCVLGLRVYTRDAGVSIALVKPRDDEEGAILDVDGGTAAGATM